MKKIVLVFGFLIFVFVSGIYFVTDYLALGKKSVEPGKIQNLVERVNESIDSINNESKPVEYKVETWATNLFVPWDIEFTSMTRALVTERSGAIRVVENNVLNPKPVFQFEGVSNRSEEGLMGMALDPEYDLNRSVYVCIAYPKNGAIVDRVVRMIDEENGMKEAATLIDDIPAAQYHSGCRVAFGPDQKLYISTGDATDKNISQDLKSLGGKILRLNTDGSIPSDNPFPDSPVYSLGHRNPQGIAWHPNGTMWETEHGPSGFDGPGGGDEVNMIEAGKNYGWPVVSHEKTKAGFEDPKLVFTPAEAPGSAMFYSGKVFPQFKGDLFFGALKGEGIIRVGLSDDGKKVEFFEKLAGIDVGRVREVMEGPDGYIYFTSSNLDGRGKVDDGDDKIYRLVPRY